MLVPIIVDELMRLSAAVAWFASVSNSLMI